MSDWAVVADTNSSPSTALKVVLKKGEPEIFSVTEKIPRLAAVTTNYIDPNSNDLDVGYWDTHSKWITIARFVAGSWLYVRLIQ
jgi:hypothetical protein